MTASETIRLGLIGDNITRSRSPYLHREAGRLCGLDVSYELFIPRDLGRDFETVFAMCRDSDVRGLNITYPYKEAVTALVTVPDPQIARIGSVNTVLYETTGPLGFNTDYTGFMAAYRAQFGQARPGTVVIVGAGGVGKAVAFGLAGLGAQELRIVERDMDKAQALARHLTDAEPSMRAVASDDLADAMSGADGVVNCTPIGMVGYPGSAVPASLLPGRRWAFEAVYTPVETQFKQEAEAAGIEVISGYELFFHQGVQAFRLFTGTEPADHQVLRDILRAA